MPMPDERKKYLAEYQKKNLHRIPLDVTHEFYAKIKDHASERGLSVNRYIRTLIEVDISMAEARKKSGF